MARASEGRSVCRGKVSGRAKCDAAVCDPQSSPVPTIRITHRRSGRCRCGSRESAEPSDAALWPVGSIAHTLVIFCFLAAGLVDMKVLAVGRRRGSASVDLNNLALILMSMYLLLGLTCCATRGRWQQWSRPAASERLNISARGGVCWATWSTWQWSAISTPLRKQKQNRKFFIQAPLLKMTMRPPVLSCGGWVAPGLLPACPPAWKCVCVPPETTDRPTPPVRRPDPTHPPLPTSIIISRHHLSPPSTLLARLSKLHICISSSSSHPPPLELPLRTPCTSSILPHTSHLHHLVLRPPPTTPSRHGGKAAASLCFHIHLSLSRGEVLGPRQRLGKRHPQAR